MNRKHLLTAIILNSVITIFVLLGFFMALFDVRLFGDLGKLTPNGNNMFSMFTVDSNILLGIFSIPILVYEILVYIHKKESIPLGLYILKFVGTVGTSLTFLTVMFYLSPLLGSDFYRLFLDGNFFYHLVVPVLGIISFIFFEYDHTKINFKFTFVGITPMVIYAVYYCINAFTHMDENGNIPWEYDVYAFVQKGIGVAIIMIFVMVAFTYLISFLLYLFNNMMNKHHQKENAK